MLKITLDALPPAAFSANRSNSNFWVKAKARKEAHADVGLALLKAGWDSTQMPMEQVLVTVTFYLPTKGKRDHGGLVERMKPIYDALTPPDYYKNGAKAGELRRDGFAVIQDDDLTCMGWPTYQHEYRPREPGILIEIEDVSF